MTEVLRLGVFVAFFILLLCAFAWLVSELSQRFGPNASTSASVAPVQVFALVGGENKAIDEAGGTALARLFLARLEDIQRQMREARQVIREAGQTIGNVSTRTDYDEASDRVGLPREIFAVPELKLEIGGVEVGSLLSRTLAWVASPSLNHIVVHRTGGDTAARVRVAMSGPSVPGGRIFLELMQPEEVEDDGAAIDALAFGLVKLAFERQTRDLDLGAFPSHREFKAYLTAMTELARLIRADAGGRITRNELKNLLDRAEGLHQLATDLEWPSLHVLVATLALRTGAEDQIGKARALLLRARALLAGSDGRLVQAIDLQLTNLRLAAGVARTEAPQSGSSTTPEIADRARQIRISIGLPANPRNTANALIVVGADAQKGGASERVAEYTNGLISTVREIQPRVSPVIVGTDELTSINFGAGEGISALNAAFARTERVILWTYGPLPDPALMRLDALARASPDKLIVFSAGNRPSEDYGRRLSALPENVLVISALEADGSKAASFSQATARSFWVPGRQIPTAGRTWDGTGPAAAVFAAALAEVLAARPDIGVEELRRLLAPVDVDNPVARFGEVLRTASGGS